jgi:metal-responsive CopG/Arc/MetJ family transcriptional regulator
MKDAPAASRKSVSLPSDLWKKVEDYRFDNRVATESEAIRRLIELGLKALPEPATVASIAGHYSRTDRPDLAEAVLNAEKDLKP